MPRTRPCSPSRSPRPEICGSIEGISVRRRCNAAVHFSAATRLRVRRGIAENAPTLGLVAGTRDQSVAAPSREEVHVRFPRLHQESPRPASCGSVESTARSSFCRLVPRRLRSCVAAAPSRESVLTASPGLIRESPRALGHGSIAGRSRLQVPEWELDLRGQKAAAPSRNPARSRGPAGNVLSALKNCGSIEG